MKRIITYCYFFIVFTIITLLELVPNHRVGYTDYDLWLVFGLFPMIFFCHGIISRLLTKPKKIYFSLIMTALFSALSIFLCVVFPKQTSYLFSTGTSNSILTETILRVFYYTAITFFGILFTIVVEWIVDGIKKINQFYRQRSK